MAGLLRPLPPRTRGERRWLPAVVLVTGLWLCLCARRRRAADARHPVWPAQQPQPRLPHHHYYLGSAHAPFPYACDQPANATAALLEPLAGLHGHPSFPPWIAAVCPGVVAHFRAFPYFAANHDAGVPAVTTVQAAHMVCTMQVAAMVAARAGTAVGLYAGSVIGALRHGGPVPWDDDVDLAMPFQAHDAFMAQCGAMKDRVHPDVTVACVPNPCGEYIKIFVQDRCAAGAGSGCAPVSRNSTAHAWRWPFADIFLYRANATTWEESTRAGGLSRRKRSFPLAAMQRVGVVDTRQAEVGVGVGAAGGTAGGLGAHSRKVEVGAAGGAAARLGAHSRKVGAGAAGGAAAGLGSSRTRQVVVVVAAAAGLAGHGASHSAPPPPPPPAAATYYYYFGGLTLPGPAPEYASLEYEWHTCQTGGYNHRLEARIRRDVAKLRLNCCEAAKHLPFVVGDSLVGAGGAVRTRLASLMQDAGDGGGGAA